MFEGFNDNPFLFACFFPSHSNQRGTKAPYGFAFVFCFVYHILTDSKESKMRDHRPPLPDTGPCDGIFAVSLPFLKLEWVYVESCHWPPGSPVVLKTAPA